MNLIPAEMFPVIAFFFAVIFGRIGTIIMDFFRKEEVTIDISTQAAKSEEASKSAVVKHG